MITVKTAIVLVLSLWGACGVFLLLLRFAAPAAIQCAAFGHKRFDHGVEDAHENLFRCWRCDAMVEREVE